MINFVKYRYIFLVISLTTMVVAGVILAVFRLQPAIDFTGGTILEVRSAKCAEQDCVQELHSLLST